jgi:aminoglycoside phosphotransferase (APT) family kinase protein
MRSVDTSTLQRLAQKIAAGSRLLRTWPLEGGISAQMTAIEIEQPDGRTRRLIVRQPGESTLQRNLEAASHEHRLLQHLGAARIPAPTPLLVDESREILSRPYLVIEYIDGEPVFAPTDCDAFIGQMAAQLASIHSLRESLAGLSFLPSQADRLGKSLKARTASPDLAFEEARIRGALESVWPLPALEAPALLHGDFWPGNVIWREGQIAGVIDWEEAVIGDPLYDLAISRLDILWVLGTDAMRDFTDRYRELTDIDLVHLPYWDLYAALRPITNLAEWAAVYPALGRPDVTEATMRQGHAEFVGQAFAKLAGR